MVRPGPAGQPPGVSSLARSRRWAIGSSVLLFSLIVACSEEDRRRPGGPTGLPDASSQADGAASLDAAPELDAGSDADAAEAQDASLLDGAPPDGGDDPDAGSSDAAAADAEPADGAPEDASPLDAGAADASADAAVPPSDAGPGADAGPAPQCNPSFGAGDACGGAAAGTWTYRSACSNVDVFRPIRDACPAAAPGPAPQTVSIFGTLELGANGIFTRNASAVVSGEYTVPTTCAAQVGGCSNLGPYIELTAPGTTATCPQSGTNCICSLTYSEARADTGSWSASGGVITASSNLTQDYYYCASNGGLSYRGVSGSDSAITYVLTP